MQIIVCTTTCLLIPSFSIFELIILNEIKDLYSVYFSCQSQLNYFIRIQRNTSWDLETRRSPSRNLISEEIRRNFRLIFLNCEYLALLKGFFMSLVKEWKRTEDKNMYLFNVNTWTTLFISCTTKIGSKSSKFTTQSTFACWGLLISRRCWIWNNKQSTCPFSCLLFFKFWKSEIFLFSLSLGFFTFYFLLIW